MGQIYRTEPVASSLEAAPLVVHCSDPRFQPHFQQFLEKALKLDHYALVAVPGGAQFLTLAEYLPKFSWAGWRWTKFLVDVAKPRRVILIAHDDCRWYQDMRFWLHGDITREKQMADLDRVRRDFTARFSGIRIETYYARLDGQQAVFESA